MTQACPGGPAKIAPLANHFFFDTMNEKNEFWNIREKVPDLKMRKKKSKKITIFVVINFQ